MSRSKNKSVISNFIQTCTVLLFFFNKKYRECTILSLAVQILGYSYDGLSITLIYIYLYYERHFFLERLFENQQKQIKRNKADKNMNTDDYAVKII